MTRDCLSQQNNPPTIDRHQPISNSKLVQPPVTMTDESSSSTPSETAAPVATETPPPATASASTWSLPAGIEDDIEQGTYKWVPIELNWWTIHSVFVRCPSLVLFCKICDSRPSLLFGILCCFIQIETQPSSRPPRALWWEAFWVWPSSRAAREAGRPRLPRESVPGWDRPGSASSFAMFPMAIESDQTETAIMMVVSNETNTEKA